MKQISGAEKTRAFAALVSAFYFAALAFYWGQTRWLPSVNAQSDLIAQAFFAANALVMLATVGSSTLSRRLRTNGWLVAASILIWFGLGSICVYLAWSNISTNGIDQAWATALPLPYAVLWGLSLFPSQPSDQTDDAIDDLDLDDEPIEEIDSFAIDENFGRLSKTAGLRPAILATIIGVPGGIAGLTLFFWTLTLAIALKAIVISATPYDLPSALERAFDALINGEAIIPVLVVGPVWSGVHLIQFLSNRSIISDIDDANRKLKDHDIGFIGDGVRTLSELLEGGRTPGRVYYWSVCAVMFLLMFAFPAMSLFAPTLAEMLIAKDSIATVAGTAWSALPLLGVGISAAWLLGNAALVARPKTIIGAYIWGSYNNPSGETRDQNNFALDITKLVRLRHLNTDASFEVNEFCIRIINLYTPFIKRSLLFFSVLAGLVFFFDTQTFKSVHEDHIEYARWGSLAPKQEFFANATKVELECGLFAEQDSGERRLRALYHITFKSGFSVDLFDFSPTVSYPELLPIHRTLMSQEVPFTSAPKSSGYLGIETGYLSNCSQILEQKTQDQEHDALKEMLVAPLNPKPKTDS